MDLKVGEEITNFKKLWEREDSAHRPAYRIVESSIAWDRDFTQNLRKLVELISKAHLLLSHPMWLGAAL